MTSDAERYAAAVAFGRALREESEQADARAAANARAYRKQLSKERGCKQPGKRRRKGARRIRARKRIRRSCLARQHYRCWYCGAKISDIDGTATLDHVTPISKGGAEFDPENCVAACETCNSVKADLVLEERER